MKIVIYGMIIGIANIIPGVSGGTMAVILKIYDKIIASISNLRKDFKNSMKFLIPLGIGSVIGIFAFAKLIDYCLTNFEKATGLTFLGLIIGSIPMIFEKTKEQKKTKSGIILLVLMLGFMIFMKFFNVSDSDNIITTLTVQNFIKLFVASFISAGAMIIPGISGSFIMLLLGIYESISTAVSNLNILVLIPVGLGCGLGILGCAKIIDILFKNFPYQTYMIILGLMCGSIIVILPTFVMSIEYLVGIILCILATITAFKFSKK